MFGMSKRATATENTEPAARKQSARKQSARKPAARKQPAAAAAK